MMYLMQNPCRNFLPNTSWKKKKQQIQMQPTVLSKAANVHILSNLYPFFMPYQREGTREQLLAYYCFSTRKMVENLKIFPVFYLLPITREMK